MTRHRVAPVALASAALVLGMLAGCTPAPSPSLDLSEVVRDDDAPDGMAWVASGAELTAGDDLEAVEHFWQDSAGEPDACLPVYLLPYGISTADEGSTDRTTEVGFFGHEGLEGSIMVNAREFPTDAAATAYIQTALESANDCPGYSIGGEAVAPGGFAIARFTGGHGLSLDGGLAPEGITTRTAVVRAGRTIIVVDAFLHDLGAVDPGFDPAVVDELARSILERLGADL